MKALMRLSRALLSSVCGTICVVRANMEPDVGMRCFKLIYILNDLDHCSDALE